MKKLPNKKPATSQHQHLIAEQAAISALIESYFYWSGWATEDKDQMEFCSFSTISFGDFDGDFVSINHHTHQAGTDYFTLTCASECGCKWTSDFSFDDENIKVTEMHLFESGAIMEMVEHVINKLGRSAFGSAWMPWTEIAAA